MPKTLTKPPRVVPPAPASRAKTSIKVCNALRKKPKMITKACKTRITYPIQPRAAEDTDKEGTNTTLIIIVRNRTQEKIPW
jgi:hypothetical protein